MVGELREVMGIKDMARFLEMNGARAVPTTPRAAVPASNILRTLDFFNDHRGNAGREQLGTPIRFHRETAHFALPTNDANERESITANCVAYWYGLARFAVENSWGHP